MRADRRPLPLTAPFRRHRRRDPVPIPGPNPSKMFVVAGLAASIIFPQHAAALSTSSLAVSLIRSLRSSRGASSRGASPSPSAPTSPAPPTDALLEWSSLSLSLSQKSAPAKRILTDVSGAARPGRVLALAGPSGSGKTSLLTALAGRLPKSSKMTLSGDMAMNGQDVRACGVDAAFVPQEDLFFSQLTVRETLELAARMRLPGSVAEEGKVRFVERLIATLGLASCQDSRVGNAKQRGISGGEKKRLSLGCELISSPRLIFADEPLSGLDSFQAEKVMASLAALAHEAGHTVVLSVHQPSGKILDMCDDLMLLAQGRVVYAGPTGEAGDYFERLGFPIGEGVAPAEHYLNLLSVDAESEETVRESEARIGKLVEAFEKVVVVPPKVPVGAGEGGSAGAAGVLSQATGGKLGVFGQLRLLLQRAFRQVTRDKKTNIARFMSSFWSAMLFGGIYWKIGNTQSTIQDRLGLLQVCCINAAMSALVKTLQVFGVEREVVARERARGAYGIFPYFTSKLMAELPVSAFFPLIFSAIVYPMCGLNAGFKRILNFVGLITLESFTSASWGLLIGSLVPSPEAAVAIGPSSFVIFIVFGGLYVSEANVPGWLSWIPRISIIKHAFEGLCINEFTGLKFDTNLPWDVKTGEQQLARFGWSESSVASTLVSQSRVLAVNYLLTFMVLSRNAPKYQPLEDPATVKEVAENGNGESTAATRSFRGGKQVDSVQLD